MKKILFALTLLSLTAFGASAQRYTETHWGIMGGLTSSKTSIKDVDAESLSLYHIGLTVQIPLTSGLALQPGLLYQVKGASVDKVGDGDASLEDFETKVGFLEIPIQVQYGVDLGLFRPYVFAEPFFGIRLGSSNDGEAENISSKLKNTEYGLGVGGGLDIGKFQLSVKYFWNMGKIYDSDNMVDDTADKVRDAVNHGNNFNGVAFSLAFFF